MRISTRINASERIFFVGREKELDILHKHAHGHSDFSWLHIYGQSGMGKSTLLKQFMHETNTSQIYFLDGSKTIRVKEDVLSQLANQLRKLGISDVNEDHQESIIKQMIHRSKQESSNIIFLLDTFENWSSTENWLPSFLDEFDTSVRIISAGRYPLTGGWLRTGWASFIDSLPLSSLNSSEVNQYADKRGLLSIVTKNQLFQFSRGIPLAMMLVTEMMLRRNPMKPLATLEQHQLIGVLMEDLLSGIPDKVQRLFEASLIYLRFNEERLAAIIDETIDHDSFRKLTTLPFFSLAEDGWMLHDAVRSWALEDLTLRKPQTFEQMRRKALLQIRLEERSNPQLRQKLHVEKMSLHDHPLVRQICFSGHIDNIDVRECRECDLPAIKSLHTRYHRSILPQSTEECFKEQLIRPLWELEPTSFITIWKDHELVAFFGKIPLHEQILQVLNTEPLFDSFLRDWKPTPRSYLFSFIGIEPELDSKIRATFINTIANHVSLSEWILDFTCIQEWFPIFELCGFERAAWADATTEAGTEYRGFVLDLTKEDFLTKLDRILSKTSLDKTLTESIATPDLKTLKAMLKGFQKSPEAVEKYTRLFPHRFDHSIDNIGVKIQQDLLDAIHGLIDGEGDDPTLGQLLKYTYIQKIRPHVMIAERLNLSIATYYRYLNLALERLYQELFNRYSPR